MPDVRHHRHAPQPPAEPPADPGAAAGRTPVRIAVAPQLGVWADLLQAHLSTTRYLVTVGIPASADIALVPVGSAKAIQGLRGRYPSIGLLAVNDRPATGTPPRSRHCWRRAPTSTGAATTPTSCAPWSRPSPAASPGLPVDQERARR